ncbi:hypothetical protein F4779DRAFT_632161 [Xylariaceae sp. FL0662B]|nr:hypothetical protein F4779DRAFT_632161 [Xylariaceae sp. FL0662B]
MTEPNKPIFVTVSALDAGHITLPDSLFVTGADPAERTTVPSLSFLIRHPSPSPARSSDVTNLIFDLGVKRDLSCYTPAQQVHVSQRQPIVINPDCASSLRNGAGSSTSNFQEEAALMNPERDINIVILSHVHWDHIGTPSDFPSATFAVGSGTLDLLRNGAGPLYPAELFNDDELPTSRTIEFPPIHSRGIDSNEYDASSKAPKHTPPDQDTTTRLPASAEGWSWQPLAGFPHALDFFGDGSLFVIDSPGHLYGHVNLLARTGESTYIYLGGDCCHDPRILSGEKGIALYDDGRGGLRSVHVDTETARSTINRISLGVMGYPMAKNLLTGISPEKTLLICDVSTEALNRFIQETQGKSTVKVISNGFEAAEASDTIITMLPGSDAVKSVYLDPQTGILAGAIAAATEGNSSPKLIMECGTIESDTILSVAKTVQETSVSKLSGTLTFVDAPVSGGPMGAIAGTLTFMVGCAPAVSPQIFPRVKAYLQYMGNADGIFLCGDVGAGTAFKILNNYLSAITSLAASEALNIGVKAGLDPKLLTDVINASGGQCWVTSKSNPVPGVQANVPSSRSYEGGFRIELCAKVLEMGSKLAEGVGARTILDQPTLQGFREAMADERYRGKDARVVYKWLNESER